MFAKRFRKAGRWMSLGAVLSGASLFSTAGQGCSSEDTAALLALLAVASEISQIEECDCGQFELPAIQDGTSNTILIGGQSAKK